MKHFTYFGIGQEQVEALGWLLGASVVVVMIAVGVGLMFSLAASVYREQREQHATHRRRLAVAVLGEDDTDDEDAVDTTELPEPVLTPYDRTIQNAPVTAEPGTAPQFMVSLEPLNSLQIASIRDMVWRAKQAHTIDVCIRKDGIERRFEADWLKHIVEPGAEEREKLRRSFVYGNTKLDFPAVTREMVDQEADACEVAYVPGSFPVGVTGQRPDEIHGLLKPSVSGPVQDAYAAYAKHENDLNRRAEERENEAMNERRDAKRPPPYID